MQTPLFTVTTPPVGRLPDGHMITKAEPGNWHLQVALARFVDTNGKRDWVVWYRVWEPDRERWRYFDGLEFGSYSDIAHREYVRRSKTIHSDET